MAMGSGQVFDTPHLLVLVGKRVRKRLDARSIVQLLHSFAVPHGRAEALPIAAYGKGLKRPSESSVDSFSAEASECDPTCKTPPTGSIRQCNYFIFILIFIYALLALYASAQNQSTNAAKIMQAHVRRTNETASNDRI
ncbi:hypothetical protein MRB53_009675 [Persea americana]|uniref:Uncharacterized protein n=1 Tax=Persea americana TaxID=3435 RepID=A0ACC2LPS5_PERAE|nr:hypothetical protein MRB53_009675 [Persea americana]